MPVLLTAQLQTGRTGRVSVVRERSALNWVNDQNAVIIALFNTLGWSDNGDKIGPYQVISDELTPTLRYSLLTADSLVIDGGADKTIGAEFAWYFVGRRGRTFRVAIVSPNYRPSWLRSDHAFAQSLVRGGYQVDSPETPLIIFGRWEAGVNDACTVVPPDIVAEKRPIHGIRGTRFSKRLPLMTRIH